MVMETAPTTAPAQDVETDEDEPSWTDFGLPIGLFALAIIPFTPLWEQIAQPDTTRRKYGAISRFLADIGPLPVTLTFAGLGALLLVWTLAQRRRSASTTSED